MLSPTPLLMLPVHEVTMTVTEDEVVVEKRPMVKEELRMRKDTPVTVFDSYPGKQLRTIRMRSWLE